MEIIATNTNFWGKSANLRNCKKNCPDVWTCTKVLMVFYAKEYSLLHLNWPLLVISAKEKSRFSIFPPRMFCLTFLYQSNLKKLLIPKNKATFDACVEAQNEVVT